MQTSTIARLTRSLTNERARKEALATAKYERFLRAERLRQSAPGGLHRFVVYFWDVLEPNRQFVDGWVLWALCTHLEAVSRGEISRLLINVPPGSMKSLLADVFWPAWEWSAFGRPDLRYVAFSYAAHLTERDNQRMIDLIKSRKFQDVWGHAFKLSSEGKVKLSNGHKGWKFASSVGGVGTGERGDRVILDDPHNVKEGESQPVREATVRWRREAMANRLNDMVKSAIVVIMQRVHEEDVSGDILASDEEYVHLCIPMLYEPGRHCATSIGWSDPRSVEDECFWPERFPPEAVAKCKAQGAFAWASQYQQRPEIRGGGIFKRDYWRPWEKPRYPVFEYVVASLDGAFTKDEANDPSGFTIWGVFEQGNEMHVMLIWAWRKWLELHGPATDRWPGETNDDYRERCRPTWGLVETIEDDCRRFKVNRLLVESKASGHSVAQEFKRLYKNRGTTVHLIDPGRLDKQARALRVQPEFSNGQIWAPERRFVDLVRDEMAIFPKGKYDDLTDSSSCAIWWLRQNNYLTRREEIAARLEAEASNYRPEQPLYPV